MNNEGSEGSPPAPPFGRSAPATRDSAPSSFLLATFCAAAAMVASGCAFTEIPLTLPANALRTPVEGGNGRQVIVVVPFQDERRIKHRCGMQKNGYNMDTADAKCLSDPNEWIARVLANALRSAGFDVRKESEDHKPSALRVSGSTLKVFVEPVIGAWSGSLEADLSMRLSVTTETGLEAKRTFFVKGWKGGVLASTMQPYHDALDRAAQAIVEEMVRAIVDLADSDPRLGSLVAPGWTTALDRAEGPAFLVKERS